MIRIINRTILPIVMIAIICPSKSVGMQTAAELVGNISAAPAAVTQPQAPLPTLESSMQNPISADVNPGITGVTPIMSTPEVNSGVSGVTPISGGVTPIAEVTAPIAGGVTPVAGGAPAAATPPNGINSTAPGVTPITQTPPATPGQVAGANQVQDVASAQVALTAPSDDGSVTAPQPQTVKRLVTEDGTVFTPPANLALPDELEGKWVYVTSNIDGLRETIDRAREARSQETQDYVNPNVNGESWGANATDRRAQYQAADQRRPGSSQYGERYGQQPMDGRLGPGSNLEWQSANRGSQGQLQPQQQSRWDERGSYRQTVGQPTQQPYSGGSRYPGGQGNELAQQRGGGAQGQWRQPSGPRDEYGESYRNGSQSGNQRYQDGQSQPRYDRGPTGGNSQANGENKPGGTVPGAADGKRPITFQCYTSRENGPGSGNGGVTMQCYIP